MNVSYDSITGIGQNPLEYIQMANSTSTNGKLIMLAVLSVTILLYYMIFSTVPGGTGTSGPTPATAGVKLLEVIMWGTFIVLLMINGYQYFFNVNIVASVNDIFSDKPKVDITVQQPEGDSETSVPELRYFKQVFHVPGNEYTYDDAKDVCKAFDARLASYDEVEKAYNGGAQWCSYGWSDNQMALFPTQKDTWRKLQKVKGHEHDCGRPGVNGGYIDKSDTKYGVNCYGNKPPMTADAAKLMQQTPIYPKNMKDLKHQERVDHWRNKISEILVAPFNHEAWSLM